VTSMRIGHLHVMFVCHQVALTMSPAQSVNSSAICRIAAGDSG
jgi:hypothetical protein